MNQVSGLCLLTGVYMGTMSGGRIPSIVINAPGDAPAIVTALEGYPMMKQGRGPLALGISAVASFIGGLFGLAVLIFLAPLIASYAIYLGAPEYFLLMAIGLATVMLLAGSSMLKALFVTCLGVLVSTFGSDYVSGQIRFAFVPEMIEGIDFVAIIIGLYGLGEVLYNLEKKLKLNLGKPSFRMKEFIPGRSEMSEARPNHSGVHPGDCYRNRSGCWCNGSDLSRLRA